MGHGRLFFPTMPRQSFQLDKSLLHVEKDHHCVGSWRPAVGLPSAIMKGRAEPPLLISIFSLPPPSSSSSLSRRLVEVLMELTRKFSAIEKGRPQGRARFAAAQEGPRTSRK